MKISKAKKVYIIYGKSGIYFAFTKKKAKELENNKQYN